MVLEDRVFRVFLSSTFDDMTAERNAFQASVFPKLAGYCEGKGWSFQVCDPSTGIAKPLLMRCNRWWIFAGAFGIKLRMITAPRASVLGRLIAVEGLHHA